MSPNLPIKCVTIARGGTGTFTDTQLASAPTDQSRNFGASSLLTVGPFNGGQSQMLLYADPGMLPPILQFLSATLSLPISQAGSGPVVAYQVPVSWTESMVNNAGFFASVDPSQLKAVGVGDVQPGSSMMNFDLSLFAYALLQGTPNNGILLQQTGQNPYVFFASEAADPTSRPSAQICFVPDLCNNVTCSALDQCHAAGTCDPTTGMCGNPAKADGTTCDDGSSLTANDVCGKGVCAGTPNGGGAVYPLFAGGPGFSCPTGSKVWVLASGMLSPTSSAQAKAACEACYGAGNCYNSDEDSGGLSWGPSSAMPPSCKQAYFGYTTGITGDSGRAWTMCNSSVSFGYWGKQP
jgi:hypothetical protein